jgi:hypothetical protein
MRTARRGEPDGKKRHQAEQAGHRNKNEGIPLSDAEQEASVKVSTAGGAHVKHT